MITAMGLLDPYYAYMHRQLAARYGAERAGREARAQAQLLLTLVPAIVLAALAVVADLAGRPDVALAIRLLVLVWSPVVVIAIVRERRTRNPS